MAFPFQLPWGWMQGRKFKTRSEISTTRGHHEKGGLDLPPGTIVKCTMVSSMGDVGVTPDLKAERGYHHRALPHQLELLPGETYPEHFHPSMDSNFRDAMFREHFEDEIVEWTREVLDESWWD